LRRQYHSTTIDSIDVETFNRRVARHAALGDPVRLAVVDHLAGSDHSPQELQQLLDVPSNLLAHHLDVLESVGLIARGRSSGDGRRRYVHLHVDAFGDLAPRRMVEPQPATFICTANSARSQLAAALWTAIVAQPASSAGTHPAERVHPRAVAAAERAGLDLTGATPALLHERPAGLVVTVCDRAHEELAPTDGWLHWSIPDPVAEGTKSAFDRTVAELTNRIKTVAA
jgi:ArsR family transcriptional regulator, arsenate/arsenite/antimonite-responsive transcriptional repressor / arsenate reductase (thioredoxin)